MRRVLIVDDDSDYTESLADVIEMLAGEIKPSGRTLIANDCLLLDSQMPVMSGAELYARPMEAGRTVSAALAIGNAAAQTRTG